MDREKGIIYGVKVVGRTSPNTHDVPGATSTEYLLEALRNAAPLYENLDVNKNHPSRKNPGEDRTCDERIGWLTNIQVTESGIFGDLNLLLSDPLSEKLFEAAERHPESFALSHFAFGKGQVINGVYTVTEIPKVKSVDIVPDGGTGRSLFESQEQEPPIKTKIKVKALLESKVLPKLTGKALDSCKALLEMEGVGEPEVDYDEDAGDGDFRDHLFNAFKACMDADPELANKILAMLKMETKGAETEEAEEEKPDMTDKKEEEKKTEESQKATPPTDPTIKQLQERLDLADLKEWCREECEKKGVTCEKPLLESLTAIRERPKITAHLDYLKTKLAAPTKTRPQSQATGAGVPVRESTNGVPQEQDRQLAWLRG